MKRGNYLDAQLKAHRNEPGPDCYEVSPKWRLDPYKPRYPKDIQRQTFLDDIERNAKRRKVPGPGAYSLEPPIEAKPAATTPAPKRDKKNSTRVGTPRYRFKRDPPCLLPGRPRVPGRSHTGTGAVQHEGTSIGNLYPPSHRSPLSSPSTTCRAPTT